MSKEGRKIPRFRVRDDGHSLSFLLTQDERGRKRGYGLTKYSSVRPISKMDLGPDATTATGVRPSSVRSAETSIARRDQNRANTEGTILTGFASSVHSPQTASRENLDTGEMRQDHRPSNGSPAIHFRATYGSYIPS